MREQQNACLKRDRVPCGVPRPQTKLQHGYVNES